MHADMGVMSAHAVETHVGRDWGPAMMKQCSDATDQQRRVKTTASVTKTALKPVVGSPAPAPAAGNGTHQGYQTGID